MSRLDEGDELCGICAVAIDLGEEWSPEAPGGRVELPGAVVGFIDLALGSGGDEIAPYLLSELEQRIDRLLRLDSVYVDHLDAHAQLNPDTTAAEAV